VDWLQYIPETDSIKVIDFKTGKNDEDKNSLQLPIYALLLAEPTIQKRKVSGAAYWYIDRNNEPTDVVLPELSGARQRVLEAALKIKKTKEGGEVAFVCPRGAQGCFACTPYEKVLKGQAEFVGIGQYNQEMYLV
ncbi:PD-(D/E)XK nuclease family protein, partial [Staphylococcus aureus]|uniref:PD-(D/E)XK nuclease family protein n=1 Tax=Staphylococcus aureus TaxID=1280 RepID=UPI0039BEC40F